MRIEETKQIINTMAQYWSRFEILIVEGEHVTANTWHRILKKHDYETADQAIDYFIENAKHPHPPSPQELVKCIKAIKHQEIKKARGYLKAVPEKELKRPSPEALESFSKQVNLFCKDMTGQKLGLNLKKMAAREETDDFIGNDDQRYVRKEKQQ